MKKIFIFLIFILLAASCRLKNQQQQSPSYNYNRLFQVGSKTLNVEVADTQTSMSEGLSDRQSMLEDQGMLFKFSFVNQTDSYPAFWMKDMKFNLDFIWINKNKIVGITPDVLAPKNNDALSKYYPPSPIDQVLEVNAGWSKNNNIKIGDTAEFK